MENELLKTLKTVLNILSRNSQLSFKNNDLFAISTTEIITPVGNILPLLFIHKSKLKNQIVGMDNLIKLVDILSKKQSIVRLNHIGFGYRVKSQELEKHRLANLVKKTDFHLYEEKSNDTALWLFLGNTEKWDKPLIEFVPVENNHEIIDYLLPHIQIDIDTKLNSVEINEIIKKVFNNDIKPHHIIINGITYIVRNRLGVIDGVNIFLDLATNSRNVKLHRQNDLKKII